MEDQCSEIAKKLDLIHPASAPHICVSGFRYCSPRTGEMIEKYKNAEKIILFFNIRNTVALPVDLLSVMHIVGWIAKKKTFTKKEYPSSINGGTVLTTLNFGHC